MARQYPWFVWRNQWKVYNAIAVAHPVMAAYVRFIGRIIQAYDDGKSPDFPEGTTRIVGNPHVDWSDSNVMDTYSRCREHERYYDALTLRYDVQFGEWLDFISYLDNLPPEVSLVVHPVIAKILARDAGA
jgi:hypothetical protein